MQIGIYAPYLDALGGGEKYICKIAEILSENNNVEFLTFQKIKVKNFSERLNIDFGKIKVRYIHIPKIIKKLVILSRYLESYIISRLTRNYDLFLNQEHRTCIPSFSRRSILICEVPIWRKKSLIGAIKERLINIYFDSKLKSYDKIVVNSCFTEKYVGKVHKKEIEVLHPYVETSEFIPGIKENIILNVGRFFEHGHCKKQLELIRVFKYLYDKNENIRDWQFYLAGNKKYHGKDRYLEKCVHEARNYPIHFFVNVPYSSLKKLYGKAKIYWHATGFGEDENRYPDRMEHFGISTLEALAAGCVPVVINKGGQPEIVQNNLNGFLWNDLGELKKFTLLLLNNSQLLNEMSNLAISRSKEFDICNFKQKVLNSLAAC